MTFFLVLMVVGLLGLALMAIPGILHHGHGDWGNGIGHASHGDLLSHSGHPPAGHLPHVHGHAQLQGWSLAHLIPSPRVVFSWCALYGAFGNALLKAAHLDFKLAALLAIIPTLAIERLLINPFWKFLFKFQGQPASPLEALVMTEAKAVTPFRNGRGMVSVELDGRALQMRAELRADQSGMPIKVGDRLRVEDVDAGAERVTVSVR